MKTTIVSSELNGVSPKANYRVKLLVLISTFLLSPLMGRAEAPPEVWIGKTLAAGPINRYSTSGLSIGSFNSGSPVGGIVLVGSEVWVGSTLAAGPVNRYSTSGISLGSFNSGSPVGGISLVGSEVWVGSTLAAGPISRYSTSGISLGSFNSGSPVGAITVVPEPSVTMCISIAFSCLGFGRLTTKRKRQN